MGNKKMERGFAPNGAFFPILQKQSFCGTSQNQRFCKEAFFANAKKGFLGPIGDDLPSLIPLLFALMMFFYAFTSTWNVFDKRNGLFADDLAVLRISNSLRGNNYLSGIDQFKERCEIAKATREMHFLSGLLPLPTAEGQRFAGINVEKIAGGEGDFVVDFECSNSTEQLVLEEANPHVRYFPIALETVDKSNRFFVRPMLLVVIAWK